MDWPYYLVVLLISFPSFIHTNDLCTTPRNETGICTKLLRCPTIKSMIRKDISEEEKNFLRQSYCSDLETSNDLIPQVCCHPMDLCIEDCGWFSSGQFGAYLNPPNLDDFSWLVLIQDETKRHTSEYLCAGSLISDRYILTAASCLPHGKHFSVRLGDIELGMSPDCMNGECLDPEFNIAVSDVTRHPSMDLALVKLNESLIFEKAVSPICMFDHIDENMGRSKLEIVGFNGMAKRQKSMVGRASRCDEGMECITNACPSHPGGPLMKLVHHGKYNTRYTLVGIQSGGNCDEMKFTKVEPLLGWIRLKMLPY